MPSQARQEAHFVMIRSSEQGANYKVGKPSIISRPGVDWAVLQADSCINTQLMFLLKKSRIQETQNLSIDADSSTDTFTFTGADSI